MHTLWIKEPDTKKFKASGYTCVIKRHPTLKHLCGYVHIPKTHPFYGLGYYGLYDVGVNIQVHGGLTYAEKENNLWVFGFDCAHVGDLVPSMQNHYSDAGETYKDMQYVTKELKTLAAQMKAWAK